MSQCRYPQCRSKDIQITYLGKPLCGRHWIRISEMPLDKARAKLKLPPLPPPPKREPVETPVPSHPAGPAAREEISPSDEQQMVFFANGNAGGAEPATKAPAPAAGKARDKASRKSAGKAPESDQDDFEQQGLFGGPLEEAG